MTLKEDYLYMKLLCSRVDLGPFGKQSMLIYDFRSVYTCTLHTSRIPFPYLVLLVSGGHCILTVAHGPGRFSRLGQTKDDSTGEAFDKVARWLCLNRHPGVSGLSGGAAIEVIASQGDPERFQLPLVMARK